MSYVGVRLPHNRQRSLGVNSRCLQSHSPPLTRLLLVFQGQCHAVSFSPLKRSEAVRLEHRLRGRPVLPDPRWSSKCGWMESCGSSAACPRRRPARTWSLLWPRPSVSVSNSQLGCRIVFCFVHCLGKNDLNPMTFNLERVQQITFQPEIECLIPHRLSQAPAGLSGAFVGCELTFCPRVFKLCSSHSLEQHIPTFSALLVPQ